MSEIRTPVRVDATQAGSCLVDSAGQKICDDKVHLAHPVDPDHQRRIAACLNACAGAEFTTERLESGAFDIRDLLDTSFRASEQHVRTMQQLMDARQELESLRRALHGIGSMPNTSRAAVIIDAVRALNQVANAS